MYIGHVDILLEISLLSSYLAMTRIGHLEQLFHIFGYLELHPKSKLGFDPAYLVINEKSFQYLNGMSFIGIPVKQFQGGIQFIEVIVYQHTTFLMQTMLGTPRRDGIRLAHCCYVISRQSYGSERDITW